MTTGTSKLHFNDLPIELRRKIAEPLGLKDRRNARRCDRSMEETIATSKWTTPPAQVTIKPRAQDSKFEVSLSFCGLFMKPLHKDRLPRWRYSERLDVAELNLQLVPLEDPTMSPVNDFIDICRFHDLFVRFTPDQTFATRINKQIARARGKVEIETSCEGRGITPAEYVTIPRPIIFTGSLRITEISSPEDEELFLNLIRTIYIRKNNYSSITVDRISAKALIEAANVVSALPIPQIVTIIINYNTGADFVRIANPDLVDSRVFERGRVYETRRKYAYFDSTVQLIEIRGPPPRIHGHASFVLQNKLYVENGREEPPMCPSQELMDIVNIVM